MTTKQLLLAMYDGETVRYQPYRYPAIVMESSWTGVTAQARSLMKRGLAVVTGSGGGVRRMVELTDSGKSYAEKLKSGEMRAALSAEINWRLDTFTTIKA